MTKRRAISVAMSGAAAASNEATPKIARLAW